MRAGTVTAGDIAACPKFSLLAEHYRLEDGSCRCNEREGLLARVDELRQERDRVEAELRRVLELLRTA